MDPEAAQLEVIDDVKEAEEEAKDVPGDVKARCNILGSIEEALEKREGHEEGRHTKVEDAEPSRWICHTLVLLLQELRVKGLKAGILRMCHLLLLNHRELLLGLKVVVT